MRQPRSDSKLKTLPEEEQGALFRLFFRDGERAPMTTLDVAAEVARRHGFTVSAGSLSEWRSWFALRQRMESAKARAEQARLDWLAENPDASPEALDRVAQSVFTAEALEAGDLKGYVAISQLKIRARALELDAQKLDLLKRKADQADEAKNVLGTKGLSMEEQNRRLREILR